MMGEFLTRLAIALPLTCLLAVVLLWLLRRHSLQMPGWRWPTRRRPPAADDEPLQILGVRSLSPAARVAAVRFHDRLLLLGISGQSLVVLDKADGEAENRTSGRLS